MKLGEPYAQPLQLDRRHQITKTKTLGNPEAENLQPQDKKTGEDKSREQKEKKQSEFEKIAEKIKSEILDDASEMRHLRYEVIKSAGIVQVSVINNSDGVIIRKYPPDKVINFAEMIREKQENSGSRA